MYLCFKRLRSYDTLTPSNQQERKTSQNINVCKKPPQLPGEPQPRTQGLGLCSWRKRTYGTPDGSSEWRRRGGGVVAFSKACSASALCVHQIHIPEKEGRERERESGNQQGGGGENRKEESGGKGASRRRLNQSGSKEKEQGRGGGLSGSVTLIQDHWQLYFKGNSQNCSTILYNCRMSILLLDIMPKIIKGTLGSDQHLDQERFQQRCCLKCRVSNTSEHIRIQTRRHERNSTLKIITTKYNIAYISASAETIRSTCPL